MNFNIESILLKCCRNSSHKLQIEYSPIRFQYLIIHEDVENSQSFTFGIPLSIYETERIAYELDDFFHKKTKHDSLMTDFIIEERFNSRYTLTPEEVIKQMKQKGIEL